MGCLEVQRECDPLPEGVSVAESAAHVEVGRKRELVRNCACLVCVAHRARFFSLGGDNV